MDKISIIVPVYNGGEKVRRCIESIINQTYQFIEIVIIDDGSNDGSEKICDEYGEKYNNIKVIHQSNAGVSSARNIGLKFATGEYIGFVDCDDYIEKNMYQKMVEEINDSDAIMCGFYQDKKKCVGISQKCIVKKEEAILNIIGDGNFKGYLWNKLFKKSIIVTNKLIFSTRIHMCEDLLFCVKYIEKTNKVCLIPDALYHYEDNGESSVSRGKFTTKKMSVIDAYNNLLTMDIVIKNNKIYNEIRWRKIRHCLSLWNELWRSNFTEKRQIKLLIKQEIKNSKWDFLVSKGYAIKYKIFFTVLKIL